jgi:hypothetical protein
MSTQKTNPLADNNRYQGKMRHYHRSRKNDEVKWDDWTGDKVKSPIRQKFDKILVGAGAIIFGLGILGGVLGVIYIALNKILPLIVK